MAEARRLTQLAAEVASLTDLPDGPLLVALSGGADSAALLWICLRRDRPVRAVHVDHGLAGSPLMRQAAASVADALEVPLTTREVQVPSGASPEAQARMVRYGALEAEASQGEWVLTAHTADDQAETVVDHLLRGSGLDGLAGIPPRRGILARPLLAVTRSQTRELAGLADLPWRDDPANAEPDPLRNQIRTRWLPEMEATYNARLRHSLATTARLARLDVSHLEEEVDDVAIQRHPEGWAVAAAVVATAPPALAARMVRRLALQAGLDGVSPASVAGMAEVARGRIERFQAGGGLEATRRGAMLLLGPDRPSQPPDPVDLAVPGTTDFGAWSFDGLMSDMAPRAMPLGAAWMVADSVAVGRLRIEPAEAHPRLASSWLPAVDRRNHPVVVSEAGPVWVPMVRRLPVGWIQPTTDRYLVVRTRRDRKWPT